MSMMRSRVTGLSVEDDALGLRIKRLVGTTGATEGSNVDIPHEIDDIQKIVGWKAHVKFTDTELITENDRNTPDQEFHAQVNTDTDFRINLAAVNAANILSKPFEVLIFYTE